MDLVQANYQTKKNQQHNLLLGVEIRNQICYRILSKMSIFYHQIYKSFKEAGRCFTYTHEKKKKQLIATVSERSHILDLSNFKAGINMFKELKEIMFKELKDHMTTMT